MIVDKDGTPKIIGSPKSKTLRPATPSNPTAKTVPLTPISLCASRHKKQYQGRTFYGSDNLFAFCIGADGKIAYAFTRKGDYPDWFDFNHL